MKKEVLPSCPVEDRDWPYVGVYIENESVSDIADKFEYAYENKWPVYFRYSDWSDTARDLHRALVFATNIGYVFIHTATVNKKPVPNSLVCIKLVDRKKHIDMNRWGMWSSMATHYYDALIDSKKLEYASWKKDFEYEYPDINDNAHWVVAQV